MEAKPSSDIAFTASVKAIQLRSRGPRFQLCISGNQHLVCSQRAKRRIGFFPETGRFSKKNREAIKHEPRNQ
jgi:hypothetical protein